MYIYMCICICVFECIYGICGVYVVYVEYIFSICYIYIHYYMIWSILISLRNCKRIKDRNCIYKTANVSMYNIFISALK